MSKKINPTRHINDKTHITECTDGFWLWDENRGMNLGMKAESEDAALIEALEYYQKRLLKVEAKHKELRACAYTFKNDLEQWENNHE